MTRRRFLASLLALLVAFLPLSAEPTDFSSKQPVASGTVALADFRLISLDGAAAVDFSAAGVLTNHIGHELHIIDSTGAEYVGIIKAASTGETLATTGGPLDDGELITNPGFAADTDWAHGAMYTIAAGVCSADTTGNQNVAQEVGLVDGWLYKAQITVSNHVSGTHWLKSVNGSPATTIAGNGTITEYVTYYNAANYFLFGGGEFGVGGRCDFDNASFKRVLTLANTGVTIVTAKGGATQNWTAKSAAFNTVDFSGYKYTIFKLWSAPIVASGAVTAANSHLDTTAANAFAWLNGVDLSAYQDGRHMLWVYDSSGRGRGGFISSSAPAGETLDVELLADTGFADPGSWTAEVGWTVAGGVAALASGDNEPDIYQTITASPGSLVKTVYTTFWTVNPVTGSYTQIHAGNTYLTQRALNNLFTEYGTETSGTAFGIKGRSKTGAVNNDNISIKRVLDPPSTAVKILAAKAGARGWLYADANYDSNKAATYAVLFVGD